MWPASVPPRWPQLNMAVILTTGNQARLGAWQSLTTLDQSTATTPQVVFPNVDIVELGMGTASGDNVNNLYTLGATTTASGREGDAVEGQEIFLRTAGTGTGEAACFIEMAAGRLPYDVSIEMVSAGGTASFSAPEHYASATGRFVFSTDGDYALLKFMNSVWRPLAVNGATLASAT